MKMTKVGADLLAAARPNRDVAAQERCSQIDWNFQESTHDPFELTTRMKMLSRPQRGRLRVAQRFSAGSTGRRG